MFDVFDVRCLEALTCEATASASSLALVFGTCRASVLALAAYKATPSVQRSSASPCQRPSALHQSHHKLAASNRPLTIHRLEVLKSATQPTLLLSQECHETPGRASPMAASQVTNNEFLRQIPLIIISTSFSNTPNTLISSISLVEMSTCNHW